MGIREGDKTVSFKASCKKATEKALLCVIEGHGEHWIAKSQVSDDSEVFDDADNAEGTLVISEWLATAKGLA